MMIHVGQVQNLLLGNVYFTCLHLYQETCKGEGRERLHSLPTPFASGSATELWLRLQFPFHQLSRAFFAVFSAGENAIVIVSGANSKLTPANVNRAAELISAAKVVICQLEVPRETTLEALKLGQRCGGT